ncbi:MAG: hypothetical protein J1E99_01760 [Muribaculaceae bacterium]|nr:hypothetical protein [Muribaculaceae bacterium]
MDSKDNIAVTDEKGALDAIHRLFPSNQETSSLKIECNRLDYSASAIARAVEDCNAHLLNLNVTSDAASNNGAVVVDLRVSHRNSSSVVRSLERYGFLVTSVDRDYDDPMQARARDHALELLHYLDS